MKDPVRLFNPGAPSPSVFWMWVFGPEATLKTKMISAAAGVPSVYDSQVELFKEPTGADTPLFIKHAAAPL